MTLTHVIESFRVVARVDAEARADEAIQPDVLLNGVVTRVERVVDGARPPERVLEAPRGADINLFDVTIRAPDGVERVERVDGSRVIVVATLMPGELSTSYREGSTILEVPTGSMKFRRWRVDDDGIADFADPGREPPRRHDARGVREPKYVDEHIVWGVADPPPSDEVIIRTPSIGRGAIEFRVRDKEEGKALLKERRNALFAAFAHHGDNKGALRISDTNFGYVVMRPRASDQGHLVPLRARAIYDPLRSYATSVVNEDFERLSQAVAYAKVESGIEASTLALRVIAEQPTWTTTLFRAMNFSERRVQTRNRDRVWTPPTRR